MKTVVVPVDFSDTSLNAAEYAVKMLANHDEVEMILYHCFEKDYAADDFEEKIQGLANDLRKTANVNISTLAEQGDDFIEELEKFVRHRQADLVIMGITGRTGLGKIFLGSNTIKMADCKVCPVLIIPASCSYNEVKNVLLTSDLKNVVSTTPSAPIKNVLNAVKPNLHIVNVDSEHYIDINEQYDAEREKLKQMFAEYNPSFYFLRLFDVDEAINLFAADKNIDMLIVVHKDHSMIHKLFHSSHTKNLAYQSKVPVLVVHE